MKKFQKRHPGFNLQFISHDSKVSIAAKQIDGVDYKDKDNGTEQQEMEEALEDVQVVEEAIASANDANQIQNIIESEESDKHPLTELGEEMFTIGEKIILAVGDPFSGYSNAQIEAFVEKIAPAESKKKMSSRQLKLIFANFLKKNCYCCSSFR